MERIYENPGYARRTNISVVVLIAVAIYGVWELYTAFGGGGSDSMAAMFGVLFVGGSAFGAYTLWSEGRDLVLAFDVDPRGDRVAITLWRPFRNLVIETTTDRLSGWRHWVKIGKRNLRTHFIIFNAAGYPHPLNIELVTGEMPAGFRRIAPGVVADFEENTGKTVGDSAGA